MPNGMNVMESRTIDQYYCTAHAKKKGCLYIQMHISHKRFEIGNSCVHNENNILTFNMKLVVLSFPFVLVDSKVLCKKNNRLCLLESYFIGNRFIFFNLVFVMCNQSHEIEFVL